jgi:hypothetical protein
MAPTGQTCFIAFAFISDEKEGTYQTALECLAEAYNGLNLQYPRTILTDKEHALINAINTVFPGAKTVSCIWHIEKNLLKKARPLLSDCLATARRDGLPLPEELGFELNQPTSTLTPTPTPTLTPTPTPALTPALTPTPTPAPTPTPDELRRMVDNGWKKLLKRWNWVVYTRTEAELDERWTEFQEAYKHLVFEPLLEYIQTEWLDDCPEQFLHLYTSHYLHLGETATSRTEAAHWLLKKDLFTSTNDLLKVLENFQSAIKRQYANICH